MAKENIKSDKIEREYTIPLREARRSVPCYKKTPKSIKTIKEFLVQHMKIRDRDLNKIKLDRFLNEFMWSRGIKNPPHKIKVKAIKEGDIVRVEMVSLPENLKFKKLREDKRGKTAAELAQKKKTLMEKVKDSVKGEKKEDKETVSEDKKEEEKEKEKSMEIAETQIEKELHTKQKHETKFKKSDRMLTKPTRRSIAAN